MPAKPWAKWAGSKRQLAPEILARMPDYIGRYREPFLGAGAVFFALAAADRLLPGDIVLSDSNQELMDTWAAIRDAPEEVARLAAEIPVTKEAYLELRAEPPEAFGLNMRAARFIYLNRAGFNGLYRVNRKGQFNVPWGYKEHLGLPSAEQLRAVADVLRKYDVKLHCADFRDVLPANGEDRDRGECVVTYCDPPFWPASGTANFTAYTAGGFGPKDHADLFRHLVALRKAGGYGLLSNADVDPVRRLCGVAGLHVERVEARRAINRDGTKRGPVGEVLASTRRALDGS